MSSLNFRQVASALPTARLALPPTVANSATTAALPSSSQSAPSLPDCFEPLQTRLQSELPYHRRQRTALHAVAASLPPDAALLAGAPAAAVYLAALVAALDSLVASVKPAALAERHSRTDQHVQKTSRKIAARQRLQSAREEQLLVGASVHKLVESAVAEAAPRSMRDADMQTADDDADVAEGGDSNRDDADANGANGMAKHDEQTVGMIAALVSLIVLAVNGCSHAVLNLKAPHILQTVFSAYTHASGYVSVAHHANLVVASILAVLSPIAWAHPTIQAAFLSLLRHTTDADDAFRRNSFRMLEALLNCPRAPVVCAKASAPAASFFSARLRAMAQELASDDVDERQRNDIASALVRSLTSVETYAEFLLPKDAVRVASDVLPLALRDAVDYSTHAYSSLGAIFSIRVSGQGNSITKERQRSPLLPQTELRSLLSAVMKHDLPDDCDDSLVVTHTSCMANGVAAYVDCFHHASPSDAFILEPVRRLLDAIDPSRGLSMITKGICRSFQVFLSNRWFMFKPPVLTLLQRFVTLKYRPVWSTVIPVLRKYLENGMCAGNDQMKDVMSSFVSSVIAIRERAVRAEDRKAIDMYESVLKAVCCGGGASLLLSKCAIVYDETQHVTNGWLLTILRDNVAGDSLSTFSTLLVPLAGQLDGVMKERLKKGREVEAKNICFYKWQVWSLLPGFCTKPVDLLQEGVMTTAFQAIHSCLISPEHGAMYSAGVGAMRQLANSVSQLSTEDPVCKEKIAAFASRFKKLFRSIIDDVGSVEDDKRPLMLIAITAACKATNDVEITSVLLRKSIRRLLELNLKISGGGDGANDMVDESKESLQRKQHAMADFCIAIADSGMVPPSAAEIGYLEEAMVPFFLEQKQPSLQKKAYRLSAKLTSSGTVTQDWDKLMKFVKTTTDAHGSVAAGAKASRLGWMTAVVNTAMKVNDGEREDFLIVLNSYFLSEVMLSTRDASEKTRAAAYDTLMSIGRMWNNLRPGTDVSGLQKLILSVAAGLGGKSVSMLAGTLGSIGRLLQTFRHEITGNEELRGVVDSLFGTAVNEDNNEMGDGNARKAWRAGPIGILMRHENTEVQRACVGVVKVASRCCLEPEGRLLGVAAGVLPGLVHVAAGSNKKETRMKVRVVLERLMRKCGAEALEDMFPEQHKKLLSAVRKQYSREIGKKIALREQRLTGHDGKTGRSAKGKRGMDGMEETNGYEDEGSDESDVEGELLGEDMADSDTKRKGSGGGAEVVDLLEAKCGFAGSRLSSGVARKPSARKNMKNNNNNDKGIKYSEDGKPIFVESDNESGGAEAGSVDGESDGEDGGDRPGGKGSDGRAVNFGKRRFGDEDGDGGGRATKKMKGSFGEEYRGKKGAGGDVKRGGRPDPYAYVPLGPSMFAVGRKPGAGGRRSRDTSLHRLATAGPGGSAGAGAGGEMRRKRSSKTSVGKARGGRLGIPARR